MDLIIQSILIISPVIATFYKLRADLTNVNLSLKSRWENDLICFFIERLPTIYLYWKNNGSCRCIIFLFRCTPSLL